MIKNKQTNKKAYAAAFRPPRVTKALRWVFSKLKPQNKVTSAIKCYPSIFCKINSFNLLAVEADLVISLKGQGKHFGKYAALISCRDLE